MAHYRLWGQPGQRPAAITVDGSELDVFETGCGDLVDGKLEAAAEGTPIVGVKAKVDHTVRWNPNPAGRSKHSVGS